MPECTPVNHEEKVCVYLYDAVITHEKCYVRYGAYSCGSVLFPLQVTILGNSPEEADKQQSQQTPVDSEEKVCIHVSTTQECSIQCHQSLFAQNITEQLIWAAL